MSIERGDSRPVVQPGEPAPDFALPAAHRAEGLVSLADYRGRSPVLVALFRGVYWPFCRRHVVQLGTAAKKLERVGVETVGIVATNPARARFYFRLRPPGIPLGADPDLLTHGAYGVPREPVTPEAWGAVEAAAVDLVRELRVDTPGASPHHALDRLDGFQRAESDTREAERHQIQFTAQFLVDRDGIVRWTNVECARDGLAGIDRFPTDEELLHAADALPR